MKCACPKTHLFYLKSGQDGLAGYKILGLESYFPSELGKHCSTFIPASNVALGNSDAILIPDPLHETHGGEGFSVL